ncbi:MAG: hypothetical protein P0116_10120 [Candidatus Nitrosocosmicus sp.]|nr:hypothetical protein [Candidatus Nitrosocosmicus sp.]
MCCRKTETSDYSLSNYNTFYLLVRELQKKFSIKQLWLVEEGGNLNKKYDAQRDIYNVFSFHHFGEIIDVLQPDLVITIGGDYEFLERSMLKAAAAKGIPSVDITSTVIEQGYFTKEYSSGIFSGRINALRDHGKNILKKYIFLIKTLYKTNYSVIYILNCILKDAYLPFTTFVPRYNFGGGSINIVSTPDWVKFLMSKGIDKNKIVVSGECSMDPIFHRVKLFKKEDGRKRVSNLTNRPMQILLVTTQMVEHGYWKPYMRDTVVTAIVRGFKEEFGNNVVIKIKIHPVSENKETYSRLIRGIAPETEIHQQGDLVELIANSDYVVGFGITSAYFQAFLLRKPLFLMNIFKEESERNVYFREK